MGTAKGLMQKAKKSRGREARSFRTKDEDPNRGYFG